MWNFFYRGLTEVFIASPFCDLGHLGQVKRNYLLWICRESRFGTNRIRGIASAIASTITCERRQHMLRRNQGEKRPGGETGSPLLGQCVMRRKTGTGRKKAGRWNGQCALGLSWANVWCGEGLARALLPRFRCNYLLSSNRKWHFLSLFLSYQWRLFKGLFDLFGPELNTILSFGTLPKYFRRKLLKFEWNKTAAVSNAGMSRLSWPSCAPLLISRVLHITPVQILHMLKIDSFYIT